MKRDFHPDWWLKSLSGLVLGWTLALALSGLWAWWGPDAVQGAVKAQFTMWLIAPLWMTILGAVFFVRRGRTVVLVLLSANLAAYAALFATRFMVGT
ncbi:MAG: hypothetical protein AB1766_10440 [Pseudomonadota bacterium]